MSTPLLKPASTFEQVMNYIQEESLGNLGTLWVDKETFNNVRDALRANDRFSDNSVIRFGERLEVMRWSVRLIPEVGSIWPIKI